jgi:predicted Zn-dependent protease
MLRAALDQLPGDPALSAQLAAVLAAQNKAEALPLLKKLHQDRPEEPAITRMLAEVEAEAGDFAGSEALYSGLLAANPNDHVLVAAHGENLVHLNRYPEAVKTFQKATELDPTDGEAWGGLAFAALRTNQTSIALNALATRSKYLQETPGTYFLWATSYDMVHDKAEATKYYHRFLDSAAGKFPNQEWQARQRLLLLENKK